MTPNLKGKVVLVTGASSGIGEATVYELAKTKAKLVLAARRIEKLELIKKDINSVNPNVLLVKTDLTKKEQIDNLVSQAYKKYGRIDVLFNIAGWGSYGWIENLSFEDIKGQFDVNVVAMAYLTHKIVPIMKDQHSGHIINISSYASRIPVPPMNIYASTKYAVEGLTEVLRRELSIWGIKVTRVHPGSVAGTEFNKNATNRGGVTYRFAGIGRISKEYTAKKLVELIDHPKKELFLGSLYGFLAFFQSHASWLVDFIIEKWIYYTRKNELNESKTT